MTENLFQTLIVACAKYNDLSYFHMEPDSLEIRRRGFCVFPEDGEPLNPMRIIATHEKLTLEVLGRNHRELQLPAESRKLDEFIKSLAAYGQYSFCPGVTKTDLRNYDIKLAVAKKAVRSTVPYNRMEGLHCQLYYGHSRRQVKFEPVKMCGDCHRYLRRLRFFDKTKIKKLIDKQILEENFQQTSGMRCSQAVPTQKKTQKRSNKPDRCRQITHVENSLKTFGSKEFELSDKQNSDAITILKITRTGFTSESDAHASARRPCSQHNVKVEKNETTPVVSSLIVNDVCLCEDVRQPCSQQKVQSANNNVQANGFQSNSTKWVMEQPSKSSLQNNVSFLCTTQINEVESD